MDICHSGSSSSILTPYSIAGVQFADNDLLMYREGLAALYVRLNCARASCFFTDDLLNVSTQLILDVGFDHRFTCIAALHLNEQAIEQYELEQ